LEGINLKGLLAQKDKKVYTLKNSRNRGFGIREENISKIKQKRGREE